MKTTLNLPDDLFRTIKIRAAEQNRKLQDVIADLLRRGLAMESSQPKGKVQFPLIVGGYPGDLSPERVSELSAHG